IDWTDPWLITLLVGHSIIILITFLTRNHGNIQAILFFALLLLVYFSERINEIAARNWQNFSRQQYFDSKGMFMSIVFSIPLLLNCIIMVCNWLYMSGTLMVKLKKAQLREQIKAEKALSLSEQKKSKHD
uniref:Transmembrane protein 18 n=1 Tax=Strigamia maritima TaxID=126957 RepID=T1JB36_STRMM